MAAQEAQRNSKNPLDLKVGHSLYCIGHSEKNEGVLSLALDTHHRGWQPAEGADEYQLCLTRFGHANMTKQHFNPHEFGANS